MSEICKCPICEKGIIIEKDKLFECSNSTSERKEDGTWENTGTCTYKIFKSGLSKLGHPEITAEEVTSVIENGSHEFDLISKQGKPYTGKGIVDDRFGIKIDFNS